MGSCSKQVFIDITRAHYKRFKDRAREVGVSVRGNYGEISKKGATVKWSFDPKSNTLEVECTKAPFLVPCSMVHSMISDFIATHRHVNPAAKMEM